MAPKSPTISKTSHIALLAQGEGQTPTRIRYLSPRQVRELTSLSERTLGRLAERGKFPQPIPLCEGSTRIGFVESEVLEWNAARLAAARGRTTWGPQDPLPSTIADPKPASGGRCHQSPSPDPSRLSGSRREQVHPQPTPDKTAIAHPAGH
jgi:predicted DNA-binding transcriptional regulator AlpA